jgi:transcription-repair coupling factor (superfamily II helicase)
MTALDGNPKQALIDVVLPRGQERWRRFKSLPGAAQALQQAELARLHPGLVVVVTRDAHAAHEREADLKVLAPQLAVLHLPDWETLPYDLYSPHPGITGQRIGTLASLPGQSRGVLVVPIATLLQRLAPRRWLVGNTISLKKRQKLKLEDEGLRLEAAGYRRVGQVLEPGDYAIRGSLLDLYPMGAETPYRIELFDDEIDTLRSFDPETQRSTGPVDAIELLPAREFPFDEAAQKAFRERLLDRFDLNPRRSTLFQDAKNGIAPPGVEYYLPLFFDATETLFDYVGGKALFVLEPGVLEAAAAFITQAKERHAQRCGDIDRPILEVDELFLGEQALRERLNTQYRILLDEGPEATVALAAQPAPSLPVHSRHEEPCAALASFLGSYPGRVLVCADSTGRREALIDLLGGNGLRPQTVDSLGAFLAGDVRWAITVASLSDGCALDGPRVTFLTERQLYGERVRQERRRRTARARDPESIIRDLGELAMDAPVVHSDHGVGRFKGLITLDAGGITAEYLTLEYAGGDKLYVPVAHLELVSRYTGASPETAPLHSLNSDAWQRAKQRAAQKVRDVAAELLEIYAKREARGGTALGIDRRSYQDFAASFPFEETPDQANAIEAVLADLASPKAMDRVVCGDVGFGKTEVALRAAFATAISGKQVAVLVPTTLLAEQHYRNFADRLADWPLKVDVLSRFKSKKEVTAAMAKLESGQIDVIVGTHRLLGDDVRFKDLGLVIVDEEQRFGVRQKEQLKKLRAEVDLLTLTATPIPRTLNMALSGLRDLSIIATPPEHRLAVKTILTQWEPQTIREAIQRELARGGQVYFLHNEVETIEKAARELTEIVPEIRYEIAHGQMPDSQLERIMADFYRQRFNVLVASTIIESGIDVPTANTMLINRADRFGLAQLHQLRGRVGRSHHRAYCYLITPPTKAMTPDAAKRLEALASLEELGAGFTLATHDLEIRGAGELLGDEQSGEIHEVGFTLYTELLERAVKSLKQGKLPDLDAPPDRGADVNLHAPALIPDDFLPDVHARLMIYKRLSSAKDEGMLQELKVELIDRFGLLPEPVQNLFAVSALKLRATAMGIKKLDLGESGGRVLFEPKPKIDTLKLIQLVQREPKTYSFEGQDKLRIRMPMNDGPTRLRVAEELMGRIAVRG